METKIQHLLKKAKLLIIVITLQRLDYKQRAMRAELVKTGSEKICSGYGYFL